MASPPSALHRRGRCVALQRLCRSLIAALAVGYSMQECRVVAIAAEAFREKFGGRRTNLRIRFKYPTKRLILCSLDQDLLEAPMLGDVVHVVLLL